MSIKSKSLSEEERLQTLYSYGIIDTEAEKEFDNLARLAAQICDVPIAKINFLDKQRIWTKANFGNDIIEMPREEGFCHFTIRNERFMVVENAAEDDRFKDFEFVKDDPGVRFYAGYNIQREGYNLGTICVLGGEPKQLTESQHDALDTLAAEVEARLELRKRNRDLEMTTAFLEASVDLMLIVSPEDLLIKKVSTKIEKLLGYNCGEVHNRPLFELFTDKDFRKKVRDWAVQESKASFNTNQVFTKDSGEKVYLDVAVTENNNQWLITARNITRSKLTEEELFREKTISDTIINSLPINFYMYDEEGNAVRWNRNSVESTGYSDEEIADLDPTVFFADADKAFVEQKIEEIFEKGFTRFEAEMVHKNGRSSSYLFSAVSFEYEDKKYMIGTGQNISEQRKREEKLEELLSEKEVLLAEVHHRVKNNLAVISGFLQLEEFVHEDPQIKSLLLGNQMRIQSMAMIHEELYNEKNFSRLHFGQYLKKLLNSIQQNRDPGNKQIRLVSDIDRVTLNLNQAVPVALIVNELVANAYEFAFEGRDEGTIRVDLKSNGSEISLRVEDDGIGLPDDFVLEESPTLGTTLISSLSDQIDSKLYISTSDKGTEYQLHFVNQRVCKGSSANHLLRKIV